MKVYGDPRRAIKKDKFHPMAGYFKAMESFRKNGQHVKGGTFHKLAVKLDRTLPRGLREKGCAKCLTSTLLLEHTNEKRVGA
jgi:hypothetical protein